MQLTICCHSVRFLLISLKIRGYNIDVNRCMQAPLQIASRKGWAPPYTAPPNPREPACKNVKHKGNILSCAAAGYLILSACCSCSLFINLIL